MSFKKPLWGFLSNGLSSVVIPAAVSLGVALAAQHFQDNSDQRDRNIADFYSDSKAFDGAIANYVNHILSDGKPDDVASNQLLQQIMAQYDELGQVTPYLPAKDQAVVISYRAALAGMRDNLPSYKTAPDLKPFWEETSNLLVLRNKIQHDITS